MPVVADWVLDLTSQLAKGWLRPSLVFSSLSLSVILSSNERSKASLEKNMKPAWQARLIWNVSTFCNFPACVVRPPDCSFSLVHIHTLLCQEEFRAQECVGVFHSPGYTVGQKMVDMS